MTRPCVQIKADNQIAALRRHLDEMLPRFTALEGVVGLTLNGGMSRGYADHLSEVDVTFYLEPEAFQVWESGKAPIATGITVLNGQLYDIKYVSYAGEKEGAWEPVTLWDASYAEVLYDPQGLLHMSQSLEWKPVHWKERLSAAMSTSDPFYPVIRLDQDRIVLDREALLRVGPEAMYSWHYAVLQAAR